MKGHVHEAIARLERAVLEIAVVTNGRIRTGTLHDQADAVVGSLATDSAIAFDPMPILAALFSHGIRAVVIGQVAGIMHGSSELTGDLDLLWSGEAGEAASLAAAFASVGASLTDGDGASLSCDVDAFSLPKVFFHAAMASGDCCTPKLPWGDLDIDGIIDRAEMAVGRGITVWYVTAADLITMRRSAGRVKDLRRADELEQLAGRPPAS